ncbi:major facilitator superfamily transporter protein [Rutstroemia sp. NJR-2017a BVV2]|nr:major facilitator superfamily transporter protein [Rutstroemia sp. NJR-2017a BVV2]
MEMQTLHHVPPKRSSSDEPEDAIPESSSTSTTSTSAAHLTPDSEDGSELYAETDESFQLRTRHSERQEDDDDSMDDEAEGGYHDSRRRRGSISTVQSYQLYTPDEERAVVRKFDKKLVLFVAFLYMLSFLDRSSISPLVFEPLLSCRYYRRGFWS